MKILYLLCFVLLSQASSAETEVTYKNNLNRCHPSKEAMNDYEPKAFQPTNNLLRAAGAMPVVCGSRLVLRGRVLDSKCVPVSDAKVYLWQVGCDGRYPYVPLRNKAQGRHLNLNSGSSFLGNGVATTDNNGEFQFITIYPAKAEKGKHVINMRVEHREIGSTQIELVPAQSDEVYDFTVVMKEQSLYKRY